MHNKMPFLWTNVVKCPIITINKVYLSSGIGIVNILTDAAIAIWFKIKCIIIRILSKMMMV